MSCNTGVEAKSGEVVHVTVGGSGRKVIGQLRTTPANGVTDWNSDFQMLVGQRPRTQVRSPSGSFCSLFNYYLQIAADGTFVAEDVPPGQYQLLISLTEPVEPPPVASVDSHTDGQSGALATADPAAVQLRKLQEHPKRQIGNLTMDVVIPQAANQATEDPADLGVITVELRR